MAARPKSSKPDDVAQQPCPILYSFRRCPYAMRARLALKACGQSFVLREIALSDKPAEMLMLSPKATVPVLQLTDGRVLDQSMDIVLWALACDDPQQWLAPESGTADDMKALIAVNDGSFKHHLDRYKYAARYEKGVDPAYHRAEGARFLGVLNDRIGFRGQLFGGHPALADFAIFPFVRQFANTDRDWFDHQPLANLQTWLAEHLTSALFADVMEKMPIWVPASRR